MWKVLIVAHYSATGGGAAITSQVVEFDTLDEANDAADSVKGPGMKAVCLFKQPRFREVRVQYVEGEGDGC